MVFPWIAISIVLLLIILIAALILWKVKKKEHEPDYYAFFIIGLCWLPIGIPLDNYALSAMGFIFMVIGLVHKDKWRKNHRTWKQLSPEERKIKGIILAVLGVLVLIGLVFFLLADQGLLKV
ncbi:hypothetical protein JW826_00035 [Candidatus Woesearchaeota archaeon]|nr:hypothetical protein [Candidatus Woesearchaeota archaeon]